ncbi:hypothetical protein EG68_04090 [Paragonimus skrjabini miyazakii]|uniref:Uncharacterized protein n=1 Tax=Paragonimus skrjabini miyazakii TaxID=59628 RepID=A0A8S9YZJ6_9TREM|nr:hypothetical protein EG68_04090 [Paragonimus skrjabini miyazakii]
MMPTYERLQPAWMDPLNVSNHFSVDIVFELTEINECAGNALEDTLVNPQMSRTRKLENTGPSNSKFLQSQIIVHMAGACLQLENLEDLQTVHTNQLFVTEVTELVNDE